MSAGGLVQSTAGALRAIGVRVQQSEDARELRVTFDDDPTDARAERWVLAPDDWPRDGSEPLIEVGGVAYVPDAPES